MYYINFYFKNIVYDERYYSGTFLCPDKDVKCDFTYNRLTKEFLIKNNNRPVNEILPIPVWWLDKKLEENGILKSEESKISY